MNFEYEKRLEAAIDRRLKNLPDIPAPAILIARVMDVLERRLHLPWYRQSWQRWPPVLRAAALVLLLALFAGICVGSWDLSHLTGVMAMTDKVSGWISGAGALWSAVTMVVNVLVAFVKQLGTGFLIGCSVAMVLGYAIFVALGTAYVRLAFARR